VALKLITPPTILPVTVSEAKFHERIHLNEASNDAEILAMLQACTQIAEEYTRRAFITQTWEYQTTQITPMISIPRPRLQSVADTVTYTNIDNETIPVPASTYFVDKVFEPGRLIFKNGYIPFSLGRYWGWWGYPWVEGNFFNGFITLRFTAGYGDNASDVPALIKQGILQIFGAMYQNRESQGIPCGAKQLLDPFKVEYL
jgi:hypothetical protein